MTNKEIIAKRIAKELKDGDFVNLGIGIPTKVADYIPKDMAILIQSENGILGIGNSVNDETEIDYNCTNAGGIYTNVVEGASFFDSFKSFSMIRGGHVDITVLGALQVDQNGDLANWTIPGKRVMGMGGAMDLVVGAKKIIVAMEHTDRQGNPKIVEKCSLPLTAVNVVKMIVTELAVIEINNGKLTLIEMQEGVSLDEIISKTGTSLTISNQLYASN